MGRWRSSTPLSMVSACIISPHSSYLLHHLPLFKVRVLVCFILTCWLWVFRVLPFTGVESSLSMDEVPRKRYRGKLEHREVDLVYRLPPPRRLDQLSLTTAASTPPVVSGTLSSVGRNVLAACSISTVVPLSGTHSSSAKVAEDRKDGIIYMKFSVCRPRGKSS